VTDVRARTAERHTARAAGTSRKEGKMSDGDQILSRTEVLELLSQKAREGSTSAMIALERALRIRQDEPPRRGRFHRAADSERDTARRGIPPEGGSRGVKRDLTHRRVARCEKNSGKSGRELE
jgi:hypothetical protein